MCWVLQFRSIHSITKHQKHLSRGVTFSKNNFVIEWMVPTCKQNKIIYRLNKKYILKSSNRILLTNSINNIFVEYV